MVQDRRRVGGIKKWYSDLKKDKQMKKLIEIITALHLMTVLCIGPGVRDVELDFDIQNDANVRISHKAYSGFRLVGTVKDDGTAVDISGVTGSVGFKENLSDTTFWAQSSIVLSNASSGIFTASFSASQWATNITTRTRYWGDVRMSGLNNPLPSIEVWLYPSANQGSESYTPPDSATVGDILYYDGSAWATLARPDAVDRYLQGATSALDTPEWSEVTAVVDYGDTSVTAYRGDNGLNASNRVATLEGQTNAYLTAETGTLQDVWDRGSVITNSGAIWIPLYDPLNAVTGKVGMIAGDLAFGDMDGGPLFSVRVSDGVSYMSAPLLMTERGAPVGDVAGMGQFWISNSVPNTAYFTDDAGTSVQLGAGGGSGFPLSADGDLAGYSLTNGFFVGDGSGLTNITETNGLDQVMENGSAVSVNTDISIATDIVGPVGDTKSITLETGEAAGGDGDSGDITIKTGLSEHESGSINIECPLNSGGQTDFGGDINFRAGGAGITGGDRRGRIFFNDPVNDQAVVRIGDGTNGFSVIIYGSTGQPLLTTDADSVTIGQNSVTIMDGGIDAGGGYYTNGTYYGDGGGLTNITTTSTNVTYGIVSSSAYRGDWGANASNAVDTIELNVANVSNGLDSAESNIANVSNRTATLEGQTNAYLTAETDPVYTSSVAASITGTDTSHWSTAWNWGDHATNGYLTAADPNINLGATNSPTAGQMLYASDATKTNCYFAAAPSGGSNTNSYYVYAGRSSALTISHATFTTLVYNDENSDIYSCYNPATGIYTVPEDGEYLVIATATWLNTDSGKIYNILIDLEGSHQVRLMNCTVAAWLYFPQMASAIIKASATDEIRIQVQQNSGGNESIHYGSSPGIEAVTMLWIRKLN